MKRWVMALGLVAVATGSVRAEDSVSLWLNYYKETSTRVASPTLNVRKSLPHDIELRGTFLVDQITSASGAFTVTDEPFSEYRVEGRLDGRMRFGNITPGLNIRYSQESDYKSFGIGGLTSVALMQDATTLTGYFRANFDSITQRGDNNFGVQKLNTYFFGGAWTQIMRRDLIGGLNFSTQFMRGYMENPYRTEQHPTHRNRYNVGGFLRYSLSQATTLRGDYCFHADTWDLFANTFDFRVRHRPTTWFWFEPRVRFHNQTSVFFEDLVSVPDPADPTNTIDLDTADPKLEGFNTLSLGLRLSFLLKDYWDAQIQPSYMYYYQGNRYGTAHIVQLGFYVPL